MKITSDDIQWFKEAKKTVNKGYYPNGQKAIEDYKSKNNSDTSNETK